MARTPKPTRAEDPLWICLDLLQERVRDAERTTLVKVAFWRGSGRGTFGGEIVPKRWFSWEIP